MVDVRKLFWGIILFATLCVLIFLVVIKVETTYALESTHTSSESDFAKVDTMFLVPHLVQDYTQEEFNYMFESAKGIGIENIVIQYSLEYYTDGNQVPYYGNNSVIDKVMKAASQNNISIYFGTQIADDSWFGSTELGLDEFKSYLLKQEEVSEKVVQDIYSRYYEQYSKIFRGYYLTFEIDNIKFIDEYMQSMIDNYYDPLTDYIKNLDSYENSEFDIMISPLTYDPEYNSTEEEQLAMGKWNESITKILEQTEINIIAPQDCLGNSVATLDQIEAWFSSMKIAFEEYNDTTVDKKNYWVNNENYDMNGTGYLDLNVFIEDMNILGEYTTNNISFSIHRLLPKNSTEYNNRFYTAYKYYVGSEGKTIDQSHNSIYPVIIHNEDNDSNKPNDPNITGSTLNALNLTLDTRGNNYWDSPITKYSLYANGELIGEQKSNTDTIKFSTLPVEDTRYEIYMKDAFGNKCLIYEYTTPSWQLGSEYSYSINIKGATFDETAILSDGIYGNIESWTESNLWYLFYPSDSTEITLTLDEPQKVSSVALYMLKDRNVSIYLPNSIDLYVKYAKSDEYTKTDYVNLDYYTHNKKDLYNVLINLDEEEPIKSIKIILNSNSTMALTEIDILM